MTDSKHSPFFDDSAKEYPYDMPVPDYGDLMTVEEFRNDVESTCLVDYDGIGSLAKMIDGEVKVSWNRISPSQVDSIPPDVTHVVWFNK